MGGNYKYTMGWPASVGLPFWHAIVDRYGAIWYFKYGEVVLPISSPSSSYPPFGAHFGGPFTSSEALHRNFLFLLDIGRTCDIVKIQA